MVVSLCAALVVGVVVWLRTISRPRDTGLLEVLSRVGVGPRQSIAVVRVMDRCFVVGLGDGSMSRLAELDPIEMRAWLERTKDEEAPRALPRWSALFRRRAA